MRVMGDEDHTGRHMRRRCRTTLARMRLNAFDTGRGATDTTLTVRGVGGLDEIGRFHACAATSVRGVGAKRRGEGSMGLPVRLESEMSTEEAVTNRGLLEKLRQSEERYRMLLDGVQDHAIFMMDPRGRIVSWNAGAERIKGYKADEIIGQNYS